MELEQQLAEALQRIHDLEVRLEALERRPTFAEPYPSTPQVIPLPFPAPSQPWPNWPAPYVGDAPPWNTGPVTCRTITSPAPSVQELIDP